MTQAHGRNAEDAAAATLATETDSPLAHTTSVKLLIGVFVALVLLTALTVAATSVDLGADWNLVVAMLIATVKAGLVVLFFMHLLWDKRFHLFLFLSAVLFLLLFLSLTMNDRAEYQERIDQLEAAQAAQQG